MADGAARRVLRADAAARRAWLIAMLAELASDFAGDIDDATLLAEGGLGLDSLALVDLAATLHAELGVAIDERDLTVERFGSVGRLLRFLEVRLA